jgi:hypothetical protein
MVDPLAGCVIALAVVGTLLARSPRYNSGWPLALAGYLLAAGAVTLTADRVTATAINLALAYLALCHVVLLRHLSTRAAIAAPEEAAIRRARHILRQQP